MSIQDYGRQVVNSAKQEIKNRIMKKIMPIILKYVAPAVLFIIVILSILMGILGGTSASAADTDYTNMEGIYGNTIQEKVWFALRNAGYSEISTAAAMGNIHYESGTFDPTKVETGFTEDVGGIGICQWTNNWENGVKGKKGRCTDLKNYADSKGTTWQDENIQVEFLLAELTKGNSQGIEYQLYDSSYTGTSYKVKDWAEAEDNDTLDVDKLNYATEVFCFTFERPNKDAGYNSLSQRQSYALQYYNEFHGKIYVPDNLGLCDDSGNLSLVKLQELEKSLELSHNLVKSGDGFNNAKISVTNADKEAVKGIYHGYNKNTGTANNGLEPYQCTWWANGRASEYLEKHGTTYKKYPRNSEGRNGNGGEMFSFNKNNGWFNYGTTPRANSLLSTTGSTSAGHVLYIEAVDSKNKKYYASEANSGKSWSGIVEYDYGYHYVDGENYGFIYLAEPKSK